MVTLQAKQLIASFDEQFKLNLENTRCIDFQLHVAKLSRERCFIQSAYYTGLCTGWSTKKQLMASFVKYLKGKPRKHNKHHFSVSCY